MHVGNNKKLTALFGLKWNPFVADVPIEGLYRSPRIASFAWRVENLIMDGGIAAVTGDPGQGKSVALRLLDERFRQIKDVSVVQLDRPQSGIPDFYRELGDRFGIDLKVSNRWGGYKALRERWCQHIATTLLRPVVMIDECQEMMTPVLSELRLLASDQFDSRRLLTIILAGDRRLLDRLRTPELLPLGSRVRSRLHLEAADLDELLKMLTFAVEAAGAPQLLTPALKQTLVEHAAGNPRILMNTADELLARAVEQEKSQLDEKLFLDVVGEKLTKRRARGG
jgi:type II secretory pathway predicted ATPase ExeA